MTEKTMSWRFLGAVTLVALLLSPVTIAGPCTTTEADWDMTVTATILDPTEGAAVVEYELCVMSLGTHVCDVSHLDLIIGDISCLTLLSGAPWVMGQDPSATACNGGLDVIKYDDGLPADGQWHCVSVIVGGGSIACGDAVIKAGPACIVVHDVPVPTCDDVPLDEDPCNPDPEPECDPDAQGWTLTQGGWGNAKHYEALACDIIASCPGVAADIATVATCYGWDGVSDLGAWVTGDCGVGHGSDSGFVPSGFNPGENGGSQLIAALLSIDGVACYGLDRVGGNPVDAVGRDWIILSTGQTVGEVLDAAMATCGDGFADILGVINESWDEGFDIGTVSPCPR
jgi:hypothetical protein